ncbi:MAG: ABC transporter substrate-binding protein [Dehalococcoidia bacterium]|nr:ABC transporter substrate-binding protein [Dehalococcoidia bacterium]
MMFVRDLSRRKFLKATGGAGAVAGLSAIGAACGSDDDDDATGTGTTEASATRPGVSSTQDAGAVKLAANQTLVVRQYDEPGGFDPATLFRIETENIAFNVYSGLTSFDPLTGSPIPDLAESWTISPDGKTYTFKLVENAMWHQDFGKFTSKDVKYSYERVLNPATNSTYRAEFNNVASIETPNEYTVVINLKTPDQNFLYQVGNYHQGQVVKQEAIEKYGDQYARNPVGTGPFAFKEWVANSHMVLEGHAGYFKGAPTLKSIRFNLIKDTAAAETALSNKEVEVAMSIGRNTEIIDRLAKDGRYVLHKSEDYANNIWIFNPDYKPLADPRVRQAFGYGQDMDGIAKQIAPHTQKVAHSILPPFMPVYSESLKYTYDPGKAKELLKAAGYGDGFTVKQILTSTTGASEDLLIRQAQLLDVGIKLEFELMETAIWNKRRNGGDYELTARLYPAVNPDTLLFGYLHPDNIVPKGLNGSKYNNPALTQKLEAARAEPDVEKRKALYADVQKIAHEEAAYMPYATNTVYWAAYPWVKNLVIDKLAVVNWFPVQIEEHA